MCYKNGGDMPKKPTAPKRHVLPVTPLYGTRGKTPLDDVLHQEAEGIVDTIRSKELDAKVRLAQDAAEIIVLRIGEYLSFEEIAVRLGVTVATVEGRLVKARKEGLLSTTEEITGMLKHRLVPKAMDVLNFHLDAKSEESAISTLKGAGVLVSHQRSQQQTETNTTLRVIVETRDGSPIQALDPRTMTGQIVGVGNPDDEEASVIRRGI